jgi:hypothetical protein
VRPAWSPLLDGSLRDAAGALAVDLARGLVASERHAGPSLGHGAAGAALCLAHVGAAHGDDALIDGAAALVERAVEAAAAAEPLAMTLGDGSIGIAWVIEHLQRELAWTEDDPNTTTDEALVAHVSQAPWLPPWGLLDGLAGIGAYLVERLAAAPVRPLLERVVLQLLEGAHDSRGLGATWWTARAHVAPVLRERHAWGHYDLGVARGAPGVLALLGQIHTVGVARAEVRGLLVRGFDWLWAKRAPRQVPAYLGPGVATEPGPPGWEHGALAVGSALLGAAEALGDPVRAGEVRAWLCAVAGDAPARVADEVGDDASLARGSAGLGHVCQRLYHATGDAVFADRARRYLAHAVDHAGRARDADAGLLSGLAGTALALSAASSPRPPTWDRALLLSPAVPAGQPA